MYCMVYHCSLLFNLLFRTAFVGLAFAFPVVSLLIFIAVLSIFAIAFDRSVGFGHGFYPRRNRFNQLHRFGCLGVGLGSIGHMYGGKR
jgi:hypothetical protein